MRKVSVVLPCLDERDNIGPLLERLLRSLPPPREIIVVDDDSPDGTADAVRGAAAGNPEVRLVSRVGERGLASALQRGIDESDGDVVAWMDCDLSMPPETLAALAAEVRVGRCDAAVGSRYVDGAEDRRLSRWSPALAAQVLLGRVFSWAAPLVFRRRFRDWTSGFIAVRRGALTAPLRGEHGEYFVRLVGRLLAEGRRVVEVPYVLSPRNSGRSKTAASVGMLLGRGPKYLAALAAAPTPAARGAARGNA